MDCLKSDTFLKNFLFVHVLYLYVLLKTSKYPSVTTTCCGRYYFIFFYLIIFSQSGHFFLTFACIIYFIQAGQIKPIRYSLISSIFDKCPGRLITLRIGQTIHPTETYFFTMTCFIYILDSSFSSSFKFSTSQFPSSSICSQKNS